MSELSIDQGDPRRRTLFRPGDCAKGYFRWAAVILCAVSIGASASPHTAAEAQALAERAVTHIQEVGRERAFADFSRPDGGFVDGDLYIFCQDTGGVLLAHGGNPRIVGRHMMDVLGPDGRLANREIMQLGLTQGSGWLEYRWPNPASKRIELKGVYVLKVDERTVCGSGYYKEELP